MKLKLPITLCGVVVSNDIAYYKRTVMVMHYCQTLFDFERSMFFSHIPPPVEINAEVVQIPQMNLEQYGIWVNHGLPAFIKTSYLLQIHEDGFPINPARWKDEFLDWDYIGAPWRDGVVGNGGFCLTSQKFLEEVVKLPFTERLSKPFDGQNYPPSDVYACRLHRKELESKQVKFAPRLTALEFSSEQIGHQWSAFGFHGRRVNPTAYWQGWQQVLQTMQS